MRKYCAMVDVDNTLFDFATPLYEMFIKDGINISPPTEWNIWDYFYPEYMTSKVAHEYFNNVHSHQLEYEPFEDARVFLRDLMMYYKVVIVSHRRPHHCGILKEWLDINHLSYDEVKCSNDKTKMFDKDVFDVVIDDCPMTLTAAKNAGIVGYGLIRPWNVGCKDGVLLSTLTEIGKCGGWIE